jgi:hypothetical protein
MVTDIATKVKAALASVDFHGRVSITAVLALAPEMKVPTLHFRSSVVGSIIHTSVLDCAETMARLQFDEATGSFARDGVQRTVVASSSVSHYGLGMVTGSTLHKLLDLNHLIFRQDKVEGVIMLPFSASDSSELAVFTAGTCLAAAAECLHNALETILVEAVGTETAEENVSVLQTMITPFIGNTEARTTLSQPPDFTFSIDPRIPTTVAAGTPTN